MKALSPTPAYLPEYGEKAVYTHSDGFYHLWLSDFPKAYATYSFYVKSNLPGDNGLQFSIAVNKGEPVCFHLLSTNASVQELTVVCWDPDDTDVYFKEEIVVDAYQSCKRKLFA